MDTNLKKGKKIRAFCYRIITVGAFWTMLMSAVWGREAFCNLYYEGWGTLSGDIYYLTEFREYISELYIYGMAHVGLGDDQGYAYSSSHENAGTLSQVYIEEFERQMKRLADDLLYYVEGTTVANKRISAKQFLSTNVTTPLFSENDGHLLLPEDVRLCCYWDNADNRLTFFSRFSDSPAAVPQRYCTQPYRPSVEKAGLMRLVLALPETDYYHSFVFSDMAELAASYQKTLIVFFAGCALFLLNGLLCLFSAKAGAAARRDFAAFSGKIWLEIKICLLILAIYAGWYYNLGYFLFSQEDRLTSITPYTDLSGYDFLWMYFLFGSLLYLFYTDLRCNHILVLRSSFTHKIICFVREFIGALPWYRKAMMLWATTLFVSLPLIVLGAGLLLYVWYNYSSWFYYSDNAVYLVWWGAASLVLGILLLMAGLGMRGLARDTAAIAQRLSKLQAGDFCEPLQLPRTSLLKQAATDLNAVEKGIENAVEQQNRSNRMRVELITNVSHDLKTPLTSIINYADLLCEENLPAPACEYATSLQTKAYRLKGMVQDVFELSKATSGNLPVEIKRLDLAKLLRQTLADMDERIQESTLTFKLNIVSEPLMIHADGEKLYRVFQNLLINALQYSLDNSRVHIQLTEKDGYAYAQVKNTSSQELDFDPVEITERFVRADASRTTEGSGLGLSIAQSFTESCGGTFSIELNADLFTACVAFPLDDTPSPAST